MEEITRFVLLAQTGRFTVTGAGKRVSVSPGAPLTRSEEILARDMISLTRDYWEKAGCQRPGVRAVSGE